MSTAIGGISIALGSIIGFVLPTFFLKDEYKTNKVEGKKKMFEYMLTQNLIVTVFSIAMLFIARDKPPTAPSASADRPPVELEFKKELKGLMKNKSYLYLGLGYATLYGTVTAVGAVINSLTKPFNYTS